MGVVVVVSWVWFLGFCGGCVLILGGLFVVFWVDAGGVGFDLCC